MNRKNIITTLFIFLALTASCQNQGSNDSTEKTTEDTSVNLSSDNSENQKDQVEITQINVKGSESNLKEQFKLSSFSKYVMIHKTENKILLSYDFFPEGTEICHQADSNATSFKEGCFEANRILVPCEFSGSFSDDKLTIGLSQKTESQNCDQPTVIELNPGELTLEGVLIEDDPWIGLSETYSILLSTRGFLDEADETELKLECKTTDGERCTVEQSQNFSNCECEESNLEAIYKKLLKKHVSDE